MWQLSNVLRRAADGGIPPVMDSRAATEGGPYLGFVGAALRGGPALVRPIRSATIFCTSSYVAVSARNPSRATVLVITAFALASGEQELRKVKGSLEA